MKQIALFAFAVSTSAIAASSAMAQVNQGQSGPGSTTDIIITGNRPSLNVIPINAPYTESTITPEAILNITPSPATTVQTLLNTQPSTPTIRWEER